MESEKFKCFTRYRKSMVETSIYRPDGTLIVTHAIYEGKRKIEFDVLAHYRFYMDRDVVRLRVEFGLPFVRSSPKDRSEDYRLLDMFWPYLNETLWNKTVNQLLGEKRIRNYATEGIFV